MSGDERDVVVLDASPRLARTYAEALRPRRQADAGGLPGTTYQLADVTVDRARLAEYDRVCGYPVTDRLPPTYPHVLAFPLQVRLMTAPGFPFRLAGLVHVRNVVVRTRDLDAAVPLRVSVRAEGLRAHPRGATVDLVSEVRAGSDEPVWHSVSTYLARGARVDGAAEQDSSDAPDGDRAEPGGRAVATWDVARDTGRRYARVSGDVNPIHLHPLGARLLGFRGMIAHGMWTKARVLAALGPRLPEAFSADVAFGRPLPLPSRTTLHVRPADGGWDVAVTGSAGQVHLRGTVRPA